MKLIDSLLEQMLDQNGSDLHLCTDAPPRIRVNGTLRNLGKDPLPAPELRGMLCEMVVPDRWEQFEGSGSDIDAAHEIPRGERFRMNIFRSAAGIGAVLRQIPSQIPIIDDLGLPQCLKKLSKYSSGLVLVTGPTGSGKSTTLAAIIHHINQHEKKHIITIEDPVEFTHKSLQSTIVHREVGTHTHSYANGLRSAMRSDPDVMLIGEMRDMETIRLGLDCASMGMLVFATLHTNSAAKTIDRIINAFPSDQKNQIRIVLAQSLRAIVAQLLCNKAAGGRVAAHEILLSHLALPNTIRTGSLSNLNNIITQNRDMGMISMDVSLQHLLKQGIITQEEAYMKALNKGSFSLSS